MRNMKYKGKGKGKGKGWKGMKKWKGKGYKGKGYPKPVSPPTTPRPTMPPVMFPPTAPPTPSCNVCRTGCLSITDFVFVDADQPVNVVDPPAD